MIPIFPLGSVVAGPGLTPSGDPIHRDSPVRASGWSEVKEAVVKALLIYAGQKALDFGFERLKKRLEREDAKRAEAEKAEKKAKEGKP